jgi:hypothetical protein
MVDKVTLAEISLPALFKIEHVIAEVSVPEENG